MESRTTTTESNKRPRSPSGDYPPIASKVPKTTNHLQINYLARQFPENLPLVSADDTLPSILRLIGDYDGVLHRHESIAGNLGACPLGPILVKRFERLFDGPPKVLKSHGKDGTTVTWLDVVEFAKNKPEQFNLEKTRNGVRVCQIYLKQTRVEISEEDYVLIASGMPQKMIPPQPISEDEEKELGALEILEKNLSQIIQLADQVSARARQLSHRLKNRKNAIVSRRENEAAAVVSQSQSMGTWNDTNGNNAPTTHVVNGQSRNHSPQTGFVAVNSRPEPQEDYAASGQFMFSNPNTDNITIINGTYVKGASPATRAELMKKFFTTAETRTRAEEEIHASAGRSTGRRPRASEPAEYAGPYAPVAIPNTPTSLLPHNKSHSHYERDDGGPFKIEMVSRMEDLKRGDRILPPCDRCRRLQMDCLKNLTACMGCTKKHAKCSWKEVTLEELRDTYPAVSRKEQISRSLSSLSPRESTNPQEQPRVAQEKTANTAAPPPPPSTTSRPASEPQTAARTTPPRRAASENNREQYQNENDNDDAPDPLAQAIMDTVDQHRARTAAAEREKLNPTNGS